MDTDGTSPVALPVERVRDRQPKGENQKRGSSKREDNKEKPLFQYASQDEERPNDETDRSPKARTDDADRGGHIDIRI
jgi:hypothetical protein